jgi:diguanylate cyclase (GGDEF)-like protein/PAS domain S-box-containing protein
MMFRLLRYYSFMSAAALLAVTVILVVLYRQNAVRELVDTAESQNVVLAQAFSNTLWPRFRTYVMSASRGEGEILRTGPESREIHQALKILAKGLPVLKLKIYNLKALTVFSSDAGQIGQDSANNPLYLAVVRRRSPVSDLTHRDRFSALSGEVVDRDVVASYIPIIGDAGEVEGIFELYSDVTPFVDKVDRTMVQLIGGLLLVFGIAYVVLVLIVRRADRLVTAQHVDLLGSEQDTKARNLVLQREIRDRKDAEAALRESEQRYRDIAESSSDWIWEMDADLRFSHYSERLAEVTGVRPEGFIGKTRRELGKDEIDNEKWRRHLADLDARRPFRDFSYTYRHKDGRLLHFTTSGQPVFNEDGRFMGYRGTGADITARVEAEERARSAQERLALAIEGLAELFVLFDADDRIVISNQAWRDLNREVSEWTRPGIRFEDHLRAAVDAGLIPEAVGREAGWLRERMERHRNPGEPFELERQDGRWILVNEQRLPDGGTVLVLIDITERKGADEALRESERRFRNLFDGSLQGILIHRDRRPIYVNQTWAQIHGFTVDEVLAMDSVDPLIVPDDRKRMAGYRKNRMEGGEAPTHYEYEAIRKDGSRIWLENLTTVVTWKDEQAIQSTVVDISERKRAEEALRESETRIKDIAEAASDYFWELDENLWFSFVSSREDAIEGYSMEALAGKTRWEVAGADPDTDEHWRAHRAALEAHQPFRDFQYEYVDPDGRSHYWSVSGKPIFDSGGTFIGYRGAASLITERKQAEAALRESEARFRAVVDNSPTKIHIKDLEGRYLLINRQSEILFGVTDAEARGKTSRDIFPSDVAAAFGAHDQAVIKTGQTMEEEEEWLREDGIHTFLTVKFPILDADGNISAVGAIGTDITERKRAETLNTRLGRIVERSLNEVYVFDAETLQFVQVNHGARHNLGYSMDELRTLTPLDLKPEITQAAFEEHIKPLRDGTREQVFFETVHERKDGSVYNVEVYLQLMQSETPPVFVAIIQDTTEHKQTDEALRESRRALHAVIDAVPAMVSAKDRRSRYVFMNRYQADLYGVTPEEAVGKTASELVGGEYGVRTAALDQRVFATGQSLPNYEEEWADVNGVHRILLTTKVPLRDDAGEVANVVTVALDITQRKRAEQERQESEQWFRAIVNHSPTAIFLKDTDSRYLLVNKTYADWYGVDVDTIHGKTPHDVFPRDVAKNIIAYDREVLEAGEVITRETDFEVSGNSRRTVMVDKFPILDGDCQTIAIGVIQTDITDRRKTEAALRQSEERLRGAVESLQEGFALFDADDRLVILNDEYRRLNPHAQTIFERGLRYEDILRANIERGFIPVAIGREEEFIRERVEQHRNPEGEIIRQFADGSWYILKEARTPEGGIALSFIEITELKRVEQDLRKLSQAVEQSPASVVITTAEGKIEYVNPKFVEVTGYTEKEVTGRDPEFLKSGQMRPDIYENLWTTVSAGREWRGELHNKKKNGELYWDYSAISPIKAADGTVTHFLAVNEDITLRKEYEERLLHQANFDDLTGLPNRVLALDRLSQALARAEREHWNVALVFIDLDNFKNVNDTLGHSAGDELLMEAARRLQSSVRKTDTVSRIGDDDRFDTVARIGGDEFLIILPDLGAPVYGEVVARKILDACSKPFTLNGHDVFVTASVGLTVYPADGEDPQALMQNADAAMYRAKEIGRNTYRFFTKQMNDQAAERLTIESHLRYALERDELFVEYQPIVEVSSGNLVAAEALLRWRSQELGLVMPDRFIGVAEGTGLIIPIGDWVLQTVCREAAAWQDRAMGPLRVSVNASSRQFRGSDLVTTVSEALEDSGLPAACLELEITESLLVDKESEATAILHQLSEMGVRLSIDDFGTGYSSLSYLKRFPVDTLKIDRAFVRDVTTDPEDAALARAIIAMGRSLGLKVVGEGIETMEQLEFLRQERCDLVQGYYFSRPLALKAFSVLLEDWQRKSAV